MITDGAREHQDSTGVFKSPGKSLIAVCVLAGLAIPGSHAVPPSLYPMVVTTVILAILGISWNVMSGFGGLISFGHAAYFGIGAYTDAYLFIHFSLSPLLLIPISAMLAAVFGLSSGYIVLRYRVRGVYFALATFAFAQMLLLAASGAQFVNKTDGLGIPVAPGPWWKVLQFAPSSPAYLWLGDALLFTIIVVMVLLFRSRLGMNLRAVRDDDKSAAACGINVMRVQLTSVSVSAAIAATAGCYYAQYFLSVTPDVAFGASVSLNAIVPVIVGGIGTLYGPVLGAALLGPLSYYLRALINDPPSPLEFLGGRAGLDLVVYGVLLIIFLVYAPKGLIALRRKERRVL